MSVARAVWGYIERRDYRLMRRVNRWRAPRWLRVWMIVATRAGDGWFWGGLGLVLLFFGGAHREAAIAAAGLAAGSGIGVFELLKNASRRPRPCALEPHCWSKILPPDQFSFPSGHTITAFAVAVCLSGFYPQLDGVLFFVAASVAASRIILGMHFLSDVVAGGFIGGGLGYIFLRLFAG